MSKSAAVVVAIVVAVVVGLIVILLCVSFADLEYHQFGFVRRKSTGAVNTEKVYGPGGRHLVGPDYEFKTFPADAHFVSLNDSAVFTSDRLEVTLTANYQYFLRKEDLPQLHKVYDIYYEPILLSNALDALKGASTVFSTREFIRQRRIVEDALGKAVRERLGGKCCEKDCGTEENQACKEKCKAYDTCTLADKGLFADVRYFQLGSVYIPADVKARFQRSLLLGEEAETELFTQEALIVQKETEAKVNEIKNAAQEITQRAIAQAELVVAIAEANSTAMLEKARTVTGLGMLCSTLGINEEKHKVSLDYLRTLKNQDNVHLSINFDQLRLNSNP